MSQPKRRTPLATVKKRQRELAAVQRRGGHRPTATAAPGTHTPGHYPHAYTPPTTAGIPGFERAAHESAAGAGFQSTLYAATNPAGEASAKVGEAAQTGIEEGAKGVTEAGKAVAGAVEEATSWTTALANFLSKLSSGAWWLRALKVIAGGVIVLVGFYLVVKAISPTAAGVAAAPVKAAATRGASLRPKKRAPAKKGAPRQKPKATGETASRLGAERMAPAAA